MKPAMVVYVCITKACFKLHSQMDEQTYFSNGSGAVRDVQQLPAHLRSLVPACRSPRPTGLHGIITVQKRNMFKITFEPTTCAFAACTNGFFMMTMSHEPRPYTCSVIWLKLGYQPSRVIFTVWHVPTISMPTQTLHLPQSAHHLAWDV